MRTPLHDAVKTIIDKNAARFYMPGHKGIGQGYSMYWDITEVEGADSLFHAEGAILELEQVFSQLYGTVRTLLCTGGATLCIQTMLSLACGTDTKIIMSRNIHRSAINTAILLGLEPNWIYPENDAGGWFQGRYSPDSVRQALQECPDACAVYLTSPDYFGVISDIRGISAVCKEFEVPLLVDNAHGAHLKFFPERFGKLHPADCGASMSADSLHKTMPAMTGGALLQICDEHYIPEAKQKMSIFGSTSPSYPIMLSCEDAAVYAEKGACAGFEETANRLEELRLLALQKGLVVPLGPCDPAKLSLCFASAGMDAEGFGRHLRTFGIEPEYLSKTACVLMANGFNSVSDYQRLEAALSALPEKKQLDAPLSLELPRLRQVLSVRKAGFSTAKEQLVENSEGKIAAAEVSPCPPGIPVVMPGELIDRSAVDMLAYYGIRSVRVVQEQS